MEIFSRVGWLRRLVAVLPVPVLVGLESVAETASQRTLCNFHLPLCFVINHRDNLSLRQRVVVVPFQKSCKESLGRGSTKQILEGRSNLFRVKGQPLQQPQVTPGAFWLLSNAATFSSANDEGYTVASKEKEEG